MMISAQLLHSGGNWLFNSQFNLTLTDSINTCTMIICSSRSSYLSVIWLQRRLVLENPLWLLQLLLAALAFLNLIYAVLYHLFLWQFVRFILGCNCRKSHLIERWIWTFIKICIGVSQISKLLSLAKVELGHNVTRYRSEVYRLIQHGCLDLIAALLLWIIDRMLQDCWRILLFLYESRILKLLWLLQFDLLSRWGRRWLFWIWFEQRRWSEVMLSGCRLGGGTVGPEAIYTLCGGRSRTIRTRQS